MQRDTLAAQPPRLFASAPPSYYVEGDAYGPPDLGGEWDYPQYDSGDEQPGSRSPAFWVAFALLGLLGICLGVRAARWFFRDAVVPALRVDDFAEWTRNTLATHCVRHRDTPDLLAEEASSYMSYLLQEDNQVELTRYVLCGLLAYHYNSALCAPSAETSPEKVAMCSPEVEKLLRAFFVFQQKWVRQRGEPATLQNFLAESAFSNQVTRKLADLMEQQARTTQNVLVRERNTSAVRALDPQQFSSTYAYLQNQIHDAQREGASKKRINELRLELQQWKNARNAQRGTKVQLQDDEMTVPRLGTTESRSGVRV